MKGPRENFNNFAKEFSFETGQDKKSQYIELLGKAVNKINESFEKDKLAELPGNVGRVQRTVEVIKNFQKELNNFLDPINFSEFSEGDKKNLKKSVETLRKLNDRRDHPKASGLSNVLPGLCTELRKAESNQTREFVFFPKIKKEFPKVAKMLSNISEERVKKLEHLDQIYIKDSIKVLQKVQGELDFAGLRSFSDVSESYKKGLTAMRDISFLLGMDEITKKVLQLSDDQFDLPPKKRSLH